MNTRTTPQGDTGAFCSAQDTQYTVGSPFNVLANVKTYIPCNALGPLTVNYKMPQLWDPIQNGFVPEGAFYSYLLRVSFNFVSNAGSAFGISCGVDASGFPIIGDLRRVRNVPTPQETCFHFAVGIPEPGSAILGKIFINPEHNGSLHNIRMAAFRLGI